MHGKNGYLDNMKSNKGVKAILTYQTDKIEAEIHREENFKRQRAKYGTSPEQRQKGNQDRLLGLSLEKDNRYDITENRTEGERISYQSGYIELSNRMLQVGIISGKYTPDSLTRIGYNDAKDEHIIFEELPVQVRENIYYLEGYKQGLEELQKNTKHR